MHYKNGREAKVGDHVVGRTHDKTPISGIVSRVNPGSKTCNLMVVPLNPQIMTSVTSGECLHVDDALPTQEETKATV